MWKPRRSRADRLLDDGVPCPDPECEAPAEITRMGFAQSTEIEGYSVVQKTKCLAGHWFLYSPDTHRDPCECVEGFDPEEWPDEDG